MTTDIDWSPALQAQWQQQEDARLSLRQDSPAPTAGWADRQVALALCQPLPVGLPAGFARQVAALAMPASATFEWALAATACLLLLTACAVALHLNPELLLLWTPVGAQDAGTGWLPWLGVALAVGAWPSRTAWQTGSAA